MRYSTTSEANVQTKSFNSYPKPAPSMDVRKVQTSLKNPVEKARQFNLPEAPTFYPSVSEFLDPLDYIQKIRHIGEVAGIIKIVPPKGWKPGFSVDIESFWFKTRLQKLNSMEGTSRASLNFLDQLSKYHKQQGVAFTRIPHIDRRPVDLLKLKKQVQKKGGYDKVSIAKSWAQVGREIGLSSKSCTSSSGTIKQIYLKWILPYEIYLTKNNNNAAPPTPSPTESNKLEGTPSPINLNTLELRDNAADIATRLKRKLSSLEDPTLLQKRPTPLSDSHMPRPGEELCEICGKGDNSLNMLLCDSCNRGHHLYCLSPPLRCVPKSDWFCSQCISKSDDYGFEEGEERSLAGFQKVSDDFKSFWFKERGARPIYENDVEKEFWNLVESPYEDIEVEYGADLHSSHLGSGFPNVEKEPLNPYSRHPWNLNNIPILPKSLFCHIHNDISGMMIPWLYVGMLFSTFCWHTEDHATYSINYSHWGETKTWYGIPSDYADAFERVMRSKVPELFDANPDLLFHLTTMLSPGVLVREGVKVVAIDQRPGEFVVTFPRAYHAGFNHGFNFAEAVNFALPDWLPYGKACVQLYSDYRKMPVFSHDELVLSTFEKNLNVASCHWIKDQLHILLDNEKEILRRIKFDLKLLVVVDVQQSPLWQCSACFSFLHASCFQCTACRSIVCYNHLGADASCKCGGGQFSLHVNVALDKLALMIKSCCEVARFPERWDRELNRVVEGIERPRLEDLSELVEIGTRMCYNGEALKNLCYFLNRCNLWVADARMFLSDGTSTQVGLVTDSPVVVKSSEKLFALYKAGRLMSFDCFELQRLEKEIQRVLKYEQDCEKLLEIISQIPSFVYAPLKAYYLQAVALLKSDGADYKYNDRAHARLDLIAAEIEWMHRAETSFANPSIGTDKYGKRNNILDFEAVLYLCELARDSKVKAENRLLSTLKKMKQTGEQWNFDVTSTLKMKIISMPQILDLIESGRHVSGLRDLWDNVTQLSTKVNNWTLKMQGLFKITIEKRAEPSSSQKGRASRSVLDTVDFIVHGPGNQCISYETLTRLVDELATTKVRTDEWLMLNEWARILEEWLAQIKRTLGRGSSTKTAAEVLTELLENFTACCKPSSVDARFCICRKPAENFMVKCDVCKEWYHGSCIKVRQKEVVCQKRYVCIVCNVEKIIPRSVRRPTEALLHTLHTQIVPLKFIPNERAILMDALNVISMWLNTLDDLLKKLEAEESGSDSDISENQLKGMLRCLEGLYVSVDSSYASRLRAAIAKRYPLQATVFCFCRRGDSIPMLCCDTCDHWYHLECVGVEEGEVSAMQEFACPVCRGKAPVPSWHSSYIHIPKIRIRISSLQQ